tara:strand:- start:223 stop:327 length:105 start_codon:yes stop_codon:yes gene_type:complete
MAPGFPAPFIANMTISQKTTELQKKFSIQSGARE